MITASTEKSARIVGESQGSSYTAQTEMQINAAFIQLLNER